MNGKVKSLLSAVALTIAVSSAYAQDIDKDIESPAAVLVPGYGPGIAGEVELSPSVPVCQAGASCDRPYAGAIVLILDANRQLVGRTVTNTNGAFIVSVSPGNYFVHIMTVDFPRCPEANVTVEKTSFTLTSITCDTRLR